MEHQKRYKQARFVTWIGMLVNLVLSIVKVILGLFGHSQALFADGIHSLSDLVTDVMVLLGVKYGSQAPDTEHPYGHARIETIVTVVLAVLLFVVAVGIALDAGFSVYHQKVIKPNIWVLIAAIISVVANEFLFRFTLIVGEKLHSSLLKANAWHHRSDAWSSFCRGVRY